MKQNINWNLSQGMANEDEYYLFTSFLGEFILPSNINWSFIIALLLNIIFFFLGASKNFLLRIQLHNYGIIRVVFFVYPAQDL